MKNKFVRSIFFVFCLVLSFGCKTNQKINLETEYGISSYKTIEVSTLEKKMKDKDDFILYIYSSGCLGCQDFKPILETYIKNESALIYAIRAGSNFDSSNKLISYEVTPTLVFLKNGKVKEKIDLLNSENVFTSLDNLKEKIDSLCVKEEVEVNNRLDIDEAKLDSLINEKETFIVLFYYKLCGDCKFIDKYYLDEFNLEDNKNIYYGFEVSYYFEKRESSKDPFWLDFTSKYGLNDQSELGYRNGVVPTFQYYENGKLTKCVVVFNDIFETELNPNGEITSVKIVDSYYKDAHFIGKEYVKDTNSAMENYRKDTKDFYIAKIKELFKIIY